MNALLLVVLLALPDPTMVTLKPYYQPTSVCDDIVAYNGRDYGGPHETTHDLNSKGRVAYPGRNCCYLMNGRSAVVREPKVSLSSVAREVPRQYRTDTYNLYMVQQARYWEDTPTYILDELSAYMNGMECYRASGDVDNSHNSYIKAGEFLYFAQLLVGVVKRDDPSYDRTQLDRIVDYQLRRWRAWK
jgi:hypothetical protein